MKSLQYATAIVLAGLTLAMGCSSNQNERTPASPSVLTLQGTYWKLSTLNGRPIAAVDGFKEMNLKLLREGNRVTAFGGVNRMAGTYQLDGNRLTFSPLAGTKMAGPDALNQQETAYASALAKVNTYLLTGDRLTLLNGPDALLTFEATPMPRE